MNTQKVHCAEENFFVFLCDRRIAKSDETLATLKL